MNPSDLILWAIFVGVSWLIFSSITGVDDWFKSRFESKKDKKLEDEVRKLEARIEQLEKRNNT